MAVYLVRPNKRAGFAFPVWSWYSNVICIYTKVMIEIDWQQKPIWAISSLISLILSLTASHIWEREKMMQIRCVSEYFFASSYQRRGTWELLICKIFAARLGANYCHLFGDTRLAPPTSLHSGLPLNGPNQSIHAFYVFFKLWASYSFNPFQYPNLSWAITPKKWVSDTKT
jgi:hypothetical protein